MKSQTNNKKNMHVRNPQINVFFSKYNTMNDKEKNYDVVIVGGGVVGCSTAYQLTELNSELKILILEREKEIASHASGKAGGISLKLKYHYYNICFF